ncbi:hypothetical protein NBRGN_112_00850 [Nocardia brasiliensis NBRC 14402]|uniref:DUF7683 domain-containing protein n=1 Tax=Nocardia brasiliensis TaxID=37326 RepID=UPI0003083534|nr:hypothetical protein [Nocardia brasiliensis]ASF10111.1 hypothetical protein CEQ30_25130 [Nocardia brasiliensis]GAJ86870.1 hypothetical protein NBRGN_112_00850 [Nocardia brasiliensis NBRC 14402]SUB11468.1 Uncharacterised protein [Nocardia brasiliensis]
MNYLEAYDKKTGILVVEYPLHNVELSELKRMLGIDEGIEIYGCDVSPTKATELSIYINEPFRVDETCDYQIGFYRPD